jgi:hypothetical protein
MKSIFTLVLLLNLNVSFSQWTRVQQLPASDIFSLYKKNNTIYAGGIKIVYFSTDNGQTWDSTSRVPQLITVDNVIVHNDELYASSFGRGVYKSPDGGATWQNISSGISPIISDFCEYQGNLYAATLGDAVFKLNPVTRNNWLSFKSGLSNLSLNINSIAATSNTLIAGGLANGLYDFLPNNSNDWQERFLLNQISPSERSDDIVTAHDSLFLAGSSGKFYLSTDNGLNWTRFGNNSLSQETLLSNAKQAFLAARNIFNGQTENTLFAYAKKDSLGHPFVVFSFVPDHFTYKIEISGNKLWDASSNGLFFMALSDLPGITAADDSVTLILLPVRFISFNVQLNAGKTVGIDWTTADATNIDHYEVERSDDRQHWVDLANISPQSSNQYHSTDAAPLNGVNYYRIKAVSSDGSLSYTLVKSVTLVAETAFRAWPNPVTDILNVRIATNAESTAVVKLFDSKGALVKQLDVDVMPGDNFFKLNIGSLSGGMYSLSAEWNNGREKRTIHIIKQ